MATPSYEQIQSFSRVSKELQQAAVNEFMEYVHEGMTVDELVDAATNVATKFQRLGCELGAQWYDLCSELAGLNVERAYVEDMDPDGIAERASAAAGRATPDNPLASFNAFLQDEINRSIRETGSANLWRDYERGMAPGRWARVPVGDTCAFCLMLASQGAWYLSEKSALGEEAGHYHRNCDCIAVYHADPESIAGYRSLERYKKMYYHADNMRRANDNGREKYPEELADRIAKARASHEEKLRSGDADRPWTVYNEDMIVMRYEYGLK